MNTDGKIGFDPNGPAAPDSNIFGLPYSPEEAELVLIPVPWDVTVSYADGTSSGPKAILKASAQVDLFLRDVPEPWNNRVAMDKISAEWKKNNKKARKLAKEYIDALISGKAEQYQETLRILNDLSKELNDFVYSEAIKRFEKNQLVALIGGDHSTPFGLVKAIAEKHDSFSVLQFDAHCDLRKAYEGFTYSHASISYNILQFKQINKLVQVGIRDFCEEEYQRIQNSNGRIQVFFDEDIQENKANGISWGKQIEEIISHLGDKVYLTFDIDALDPALCTNTGTPVPGGLQFHEAIMLIKALRKAGKTIVGFDLVEVAPGKKDEWDANVGARLLFRLCQETILCNRK